MAFMQCCAATGSNSCKKTSPGLRAPARHNNYGCVFSVGLIQHLPDTEWSLALSFDAIAKIIAIGAFSSITHRLVIPGIAAATIVQDLCGRSGSIAGRIRIPV